MTPMQLAENMAKSSNPRDQIIAAALMARGLSDDDLLRQGWPVPTAADAALRYLGLPRDAATVEAVIETMPSITDAMLNKGAAR